MDKDLEELKVKAQQMLKKCREGDLSVENLPDVRKSLNNLLNDIKSHKLLEDVEFMKIAKELGNEVVNFINTDLAELQKSAEEKISAAVDERELQDAKVFYLGKKGKLTAILKNMKDVPTDQRPVIGTAANTVRAAVESFIGEKQAQLKAKRLESQIKNETVDITLPARHHKAGHVHPLDKALRKIMESFVRMGYSVEEGPEIESDYYNFECLNLPKDHPARDMQDSFYITNEILLRTHTSPVQARTLRRHEPNSPIRMIAPGKVFRWDNDATHSPVFHQVEGLVVDKGISFADLKGTLEIFLKDLFGSDTKIRFRASYFPFTEPSAEVDISFASRTHDEGGDPDWLEILGCGMVHPQVLSLNGYDPQQVSGFAFGMGIERIAMLLYGIDDLRNFYENDVRFLEQF
ncbi:MULTISPECIES: phenylalanine--tRNA ligase subunit alpha [Dialister]|jgi:phenylalanyl-tRNA synthetase alpha chain|uniref:phenylalanine--tRNA ligase subunit alpha n=1 Tax=uncultured Dialister sp. TaxID=278064 RepID=UPI000D56219F|nr:phenylalanine--tRNA ligase subunit alpha [Dialister massiliensis]